MRIFSYLIYSLLPVSVLATPLTVNSVKLAQETNQLKELPVNAQPNVQSNQSVDPTENQTSDASNSEDPVPTDMPTTDPDYQGFTFNVGVLYSTTHEYETKGKIQPAGTEFEGEIDAEGAFGVSLGFNYRQTAETNWFIHGGLLVELPRDIDRETINGAMVSTGTTSQPRLLYTALYGNFAYEVAAPLYLTAGVGFGGLALSEYDPDFETGGGLLFQAGVGTHFANERFYLELLGRYQGNPAERDNGTTKTEYENISGTGVALHLKARVF